MIQRFSRAAANVAVLVFAGLVASVPALSAEQVNLYSARHYDTDFTLYDTFTERTGIAVNLIEGGSDALIERIANEGEYTPADILITVDAGRLWRAQERGIFQPVASEVLEQRIPAHLRDPEGHWFGLSKRARVIVHAKDSPLAGGVAHYADLANPDLRGTVCMRSSSNIYNLSLMSSLIDALGATAAEEWARGVVANFARPPQSNDTGNLTAVASGECGLTLANTYYLGRWLANPDEENQRMVDRLTVVFPNQDDRGAHVNVSGAGVTLHAPNRDNAVRFLEYLTSDFAQQVFAEGNNEYPVIGEASGPITALGGFKEDRISAGLLGKNQAEAVRIYDRAGWR